MPAQDSRSEYARRMHRVLEHIDRHLDERLELESLAQVANFSSFHFHRLFAAWMDETLGEYLRRRRIEVGALRLVTQPRLPVLQVALSVGFGSAEAFARAFKVRFGETPTAWRSIEHRKRDQAKGKPGQATVTERADDGNMKKDTIATTLNVKLVDRRPTTVAYLRYVGPYGPGLVDFWTKSVAPWMATNNLLGRPRYGISQDDPGITASDKLRYDAGVEVPADFTGSGSYMKTVIPGGRYASGHFKGDASELGSAWESMLREWLPGSGMQLDARPFFEFYSTDAAFDPQTGVFECQICIPVVGL
ncbi:MAG: AraC family transcriptional regulator [Chloroflexi bacterium]|nr:MAG: AraC family transcriptional regulator [Chloroflexota bacterium]TMD66072.1 MAG: AraC family transcriptional regulator [Chloroflexota bacterium]